MGVTFSREQGQEKRPSHHGTLSLWPLTLASPVPLREAWGSGENIHELTFLPEVRFPSPAETDEPKWQQGDGSLQKWQHEPSRDGLSCQGGPVPAPQPSQLFGSGLVYSGRAPSPGCSSCTFNLGRDSQLLLRGSRGIPGYH